MRDIVARIEGDHLKQCSDKTVDMLALSSEAVSGVSMDEAKIIIEDFTDMWKALRHDYDLEDEEQYHLCRETGVIYLDKEE